MLGFLGEDIVNYVDANYRTLPDPASRGLLGLDESGHDALLLAMNYPDVFGVLYLNQPWLLAPGALLGESSLNNQIARSQLTDLINELGALPREEAHDAYMAFLGLDRLMPGLGEPMIFGWAFTGNPELHRPYFEYLYLDEETPAPDEVWQRWEAGLGNLEEKVAANTDNLRQFKAIAVAEALRERVDPWTADGLHELMAQFEANNIPYESFSYEGNLYNVGEQFAPVILPFFSQNLVFEEERTVTLLSRS